MKINLNMSAVMTNNRLLRTENRLASSMERLASGYKINSASDNPAGMAISNKMKSQIDGLDQAKSNTIAGVAVMQIADGALGEVSDILQRMRELSVQAANGTNSTSDRESIQKEINSLRDEVDRISANTEYNTKSLLDGSSDTRVYAEPHIASRINISDSVITDTYNLTVNATAQPAQVEIPIIDGLVSGDISINDATLQIRGGMSADTFFEKLRNLADEAGCDVEWNADRTAVVLSSVRYGSNAEISISSSPALAAQLGLGEAAGAVWNEETQNYELVRAGRDADVQIPSDVANSGFSTTATVHTNGNRVTITDLNGFSIDFLLDENYEADPGADPAEAAQNGNLSLEVTDIGTMTIQIGANQFQSMDLRIPEVSVESLYLDTIDLIVKNGPEDAMRTLDAAIARMNESRSRIGAFQNRLEYAQNGLAETVENMTQAYSDLLDTDMAEEMTEYTQQNVLDQAAISVLSQANDLPQQVLSLLQK